MSQPSADARAVVRAIEALTTQVRRIADALSTPVVGYEVAADNDATTPVYCTVCPRIVELRTLDEVTRHFHAKHPEQTQADAACRRMETRTCPQVYNGSCGDRPCARFESDDPAPWLDPAETPYTGATTTPKADPAADEDAQRTARRVSLRVLLNRLNNGLPFTASEAQLLTRHVATEITEHNTARSVAAGNKRHVQVMYAELTAAQAAIERVRAIKRAPQRSQFNTLANAQDNGWDAALHAVLAALDGAEQPTPKLPRLGTNPGPPTAADASLPAKLDEATATLRRIRAVTRSWEQRALPRSQAHQLLGEVRDALAGPRPDPQPEESQ